MALTIEAAGLTGGRFNLFNKFLIKHPDNFLLAPLSRTLLLGCYCYSNILINKK
jgi:hypothetical protein